MNIHPEFKEFLESLNSANVEYLVIGAHALALHGIPRYTGDIDIFIRNSPENARLVEKAISEFGLGDLGHRAKDFESPGIFIQIGVSPVRIDIATGITGVTFDEAWENRLAGTLGGVPVQFIAKSDYIKNKKATGRPKDLLDISLILGE